MLMENMFIKMIRKFGRIANENALSELTDTKDSLQTTQILLLLKYKELLARKASPLPAFDEVGFRCYSQFDEDGILLYLFAMIGATHKVAVEICAGDGRQCNTANLIINHGWQGYLFDGNSENIHTGRKYFGEHNNTFIWPPALTCAWITAENVNETIGSAGVTGEIDLLSLDIDGMDYWVWKAINRINPRVVLCETNNAILQDEALTVPYKADFVRDLNATPHYHGASLAATAKLASEKGYRLVGTCRYGFNAFFIRQDIAKDLFPAVTVASCLQHPYSKHAHETRWPKLKDLDWVKV